MGLDRKIYRRKAEEKRIRYMELEAAEGQLSI